MGNKVKDRIPPTLGNQRNHIKSQSICCLSLVPLYVQLSQLPTSKEPTVGWHYHLFTNINPTLISTNMTWDSKYSPNSSKRNFWVKKLTKTSILSNCQAPNRFFWYNCKFYHSKIALGKKTHLKYFCQLEMDHVTQQPKETCHRT